MITASLESFAGLSICRFILGCFEGMLVSNTYPKQLLRVSPHHPLLHDDRWHVVSPSRAAFPSRMFLLL